MAPEGAELVAPTLHLDVMRETMNMDKHYGWQDDRGSQSYQGRMQNGQRWSERNRDDDRDMRSGRGGDGWDEDDRRWSATGGNLDREDYSSDRDDFGRSRGGYDQGQRFGSRDYGSQRYGSNQGYGGSQGFSGGHYGGYANEGYPGQGNYGGNRGFSNQGYSGQRSNQGSSSQDRNQSWGQRFGQGYAGSEYESQGSRSQGYGSQGYGSQGYGRNQDFGRSQDFGQESRGQQRSSGGSMYQGRGFSGRGPKGYQRSDERIKEQLSDRLMDDDDIDASEISIEVKNGEATLSGSVSSREEKRAAEEIAERSPGVREVQNHLRVSQETSGSSGSAQSAQSGRSGSSGSTSSTSGSSSATGQGQSKSRGNERE